MDKDLVKLVLLSAALGGVFGFLIGASIGDDTGRNTIKKQAIEHGAAHYDKVTGNWEWNK